MSLMAQGCMPVSQYLPIETNVTIWGSEDQSGFSKPDSGLCRQSLGKKPSVGECKKTGATP